MLVLDERMNFVIKSPPLKTTAFLCFISALFVFGLIWFFSYKAQPLFKYDSQKYHTFSEVVRAAEKSAYAGLSLPAPLSNSGSLGDCTRDSLYSTDRCGEVTRSYIFAPSNLFDDYDHLIGNIVDKGWTVDPIFSGKTQFESGSRLSFRRNYPWGDLVLEIERCSSEGCYDSNIKSTMRSGGYDHLYSLKIQPSIESDAIVRWHQ